MPLRSERDRFVDQRRLIVKIRFVGSVDDFKSLADFTEALHFIDSQYFLKMVNDRGAKPRARSRLITFHVGSPPEATFVVNVAWIAVLLTFLINYDKIKNNSSGLAKDLRRLTERIRGLSRESKRLIEDLAADYLLHASQSVRGLLEKASRKMQDAERKLLQRFERRRRALMVDRDHLPEIEVIDIDDDEHFVD